MVNRNSALEALIDFFVGLAEVLLSLRLVFILFDANGNSGFVQWVYNTSDTLMRPFRGIFPGEQIVKNHVFDFSILFAILVYALFGFLLSEFIHILSSGHRHHNTAK